ncbi:MAG: putative ABC transporter permease [Erysipelotrichaceae bacterium]|nr:putative ABC transporter permease [Erysipelotrichaceae bacterium]
MNLDRYIIYFIILSFCGYVYETIAMSIWSGKWENRGFLFGPVIPIYGVGAFIETLIITYLFPNSSTLTVFIIGAVASVILEYPTHYILEKYFHQKWWDYSKAPFNINGRICLFATIGFGVGTIVIAKIINPILLPILEGMNGSLANGLAIIFTVLFTWDLATTMAYVSDFEDRVAYLIDGVLDEHIEEVLDKILDEDKAIKDIFYDAVDVVSDKASVAKNIADKGLYKLNRSSKKYKSTIKRFVKEKRIRLSRFSRKDER